MFSKTLLSVLVLFGFVAFMQGTDGAVAHGESTMSFDPETGKIVYSGFKVTCPKEHQDNKWYKENPDSCAVTRCFVIDDEGHGAQDWKSCGIFSDPRDDNSSCYSVNQNHLEHPYCCTKKYFCIGDEGFSQELLDKHHVENK